MPQEWLAFYPGLILLPSKTITHHMPTVQDIIFDLLGILHVNLNNALNQLRGTTNQNLAVLGNIAQAEGNGNGNNNPLRDAVVLTLFKIEEEFTLKNKPAHRRNPVSGSLEYINPPAFLNLHILITANNDTYMNALENLSFVVGYLQHQNVFKHDDSNLVFPDGMTPFNYRFNLQLITLSYEQLNHIWGIMGGKHLPSAMYKLQLVEIQYEPENVQTGHLIQEIQVGEKIR